MGTSQWYSRESDVLNVLDHFMLCDPCKDMKLT